jgi:hypothetical protein
MFRVEMSSEKAHKQWAFEIQLIKILVISQ